MEYRGEAPDREPGATGFWMANRRWLAPVLLIGGGLLAGELLASVSDAFARSTRFGNSPAFKHAGDFLRIACAVAGLIAAIAHVVHRNKFATLFVELLLGAGIIWIVAPWSGGTDGSAQFVPTPPVADTVAPGPVVAVPGAPEILDVAEVIPTLDVPDVLAVFDSSDVDHLAPLGNVVVVQPRQRGQVMQHPILVKNEGQRWWRERELCRLSGDLDSPAVVSIDPCIAIPVVPPEKSREITLTFTAPLKSGQYTAVWKMVDRDGTILFPNAKPVTLHITVH